VNTVFGLHNRKLLCDRVIIIIINIFVWRHSVVTSQVLGPGSVLVIGKSMRESLREEVSL